MPEELKPANTASFPRDDLASEADVVIIEEIIFEPQDQAFLSADVIAKSEAHEELAMLREEISLLKERLSAIGYQTGAVVKAQRNFIDASAHAQLGKYPWAKLAAASAAAFMVGKAFRALPIGLIAATLLNTSVARRR